MNNIWWGLIRIYLFFPIFYFSFLFSISNQEIKSLAKQKFNKVPGFELTLSSQNYGKWFELETALCAEEFIGEEVIAFGLLINIWNQDHVMRISYGNEDYLELKTTEFDIVTENHVIECKNSAKPKFYEQFLKEQSMLLFFRNLKKDIENNDLDFFEIKRNKKKSKNINILTIKGPCTGEKDLSITCNLLNDYSISECENLWLKIIEILSKKSLFVVFRNEVPFETGLDLDRLGIRYAHNVGHFTDDLVSMDELYESGYEADCSGYETDYSMMSE